MFSMESLKIKVKNIETGLTMRKYMKKIWEDKSELCAYFTVSLVVATVGTLCGWGMSTILSKFIPVSSEQCIVHSLGMGILMCGSFIRSIYKLEYRENQEETYTLSQDEMKEYLRTLPNQEIKEKALNIISQKIKEQGGKVNFTHFLKIYEQINEEIENQKEINEQKLKKEKEKEITECLIKTLEKEVYIKKELMIEQKQDIKNCVS